MTLIQIIGIGILGTAVVGLVWLIVTTIKQSIQIANLQEKIRLQEVAQQNAREESMDADLGLFGLLVTASFGSQVAFALEQGLKKSNWELLAELIPSLSEAEVERLMKLLWTAQNTRLISGLNQKGDNYCFVDELPEPIVAFHKIGSLALIGHEPLARALITAKVGANEATQFLNAFRNGTVEAMLEQVLILRNEELIATLISQISYKTGIDKQTLQEVLKASSIKWAADFITNSGTKTITGFLLSRERENSLMQIPEWFAEGEWHLADFFHQAQDNSLLTQVLALVFECEVNHAESLLRPLDIHATELIGVIRDKKLSSKAKSLLDMLVYWRSAQREGKSSL
jgi:hypothetical protein